MATEADPQVTIRLIFRAHQLSRSRAFCTDDGIYLVRPEMLHSRNWMRLRPFHLHVRLSSLQAVYLMSSESFLLLRSRYNSGIEISHNRHGDDCVCNIGAHNQHNIAKTIADLMKVMRQARDQDLHLGGASGQVCVIVPQRVADALDQDETQIVIEEDALGRRVPVRPPPERLETREKKENMDGSFKQ
ncbi:hypothetical protein BGZ52_007950 [Haplosporangium bisporale]|nr:hypothetical protein BGZ52_007950 [Haplosporangium bisporale]